MGGGYLAAGILLLLAADALYLMRCEKSGEDIRRFTAQSITASALGVHDTAAADKVYSHEEEARVQKRGHI